MEKEQTVEVIAELEDGICLAKVSLDILREQDLNARIMDDGKFDQLVANISKRGTLEQLPYCVQTDKGIEIVSGHHRSRAARKAGLDHIYTLLDRSKLSRSAIAAKQLAHNAIEGTDDQETLKKIAAIITDVDDMLETALGEDFFAAAYKEAQTMPAPIVSFDWKTVSFTFLPHQVDDLKRLVDSLSGTDIQGIADLAQFDKFVDALNKTRKFEDIKNVGTAVHVMVKRALDEYPEDGEYDTVASVFGRGVIPSEHARIIKRGIKEARESGLIENPWEIFELLSDRLDNASGKTE